MAAPTTYFPDESVEFHFTMGLNFGVNVTRFSNGRRQARKTVEKVLRSLEGRIPATTLTKSQSIRSFLTTTFGALTPFYIFAWPFQSFTDFAVGSGTGAQTVFTLPFKGAPPSSAATVTNVKVNGVLQTLTTDYTIGFFAGLETFITFVTAPGAGLAITANIVGRERIPVEIVGTLVPVSHPLRVSLSSAESKAADFYSLSLLEVP